MLTIAAFETKVVAFGVNGMETPYFILFTVLYLHALFSGNRLNWLYAGLSIAGLAITRADAFIVYFFISLGFLLSDKKLLSKIFLYW